MLRQPATDPHTVMPYPAAAIANEFIRLAKESSRPLSPMKVQKLVYFAHGWYLAFTGKPLINEPVEAWQFGPVIPSLYHALKNYGANQIDDALTDEPMAAFLGQEYDTLRPSIDQGSDPQENEAAREVVKRVWEVYGNFNAIQLSNLTHLKDAPWMQTPGKDKKHTEIDQEKIREYFSRLLQKNREHKQAQAIQNV